MAGKPKVFVSRLLPEAGLGLIRQHCEADIWDKPLPPPPDVLAEKIVACEGLVSLLTDRIDGPLMDKAQRLRVISNFAVGFNNIDIPAATQRGIPVGNTPGVLTDATADMAFCLLIAAARRIVEGHAYSQSGQWKTWEPLGHLGQDLAGKTLGIIGMGRIGQALAQRCHAGWGMKILYHDLHANAEADSKFKAQRVDLDTLLSEADFVSLHTDLNDKTRGMMGRDQFRKMKKSAILINTARGPLVDEKALYEALKEGTIFAAGLDVTDPEPPLPNDPLLFLPNIVVAPHIASATIATRNAMATICAQNLLAGLGGKPLPHCVNPEVEAHRRK